MTYGELPYATGGYAGLPVVEITAPAEKVLLLSPRDIELAALTASTAVTSLPVTNLQNQEPTKVWRTTSATGQHVAIVLAEAKDCDAVAMSGFTIGVGGLWRLKGYTTLARAGADAIDVDSGWQSVWPDGYRHSDPQWGPEVALLRIANDRLFQYWRVEFTDPAIGATSFDVGRLALGRAVQFSVNCDIDGGIGFVANDVQEATPYGQTFTDPRPYAQRTFDMPWTALDRTEVHEWAMELSRLRGQAGDVFCFLDPAEVHDFHRWSMQGLFTGRAHFRPVPFDYSETGAMAWGFNFSLIQKI